MRKIMLTLLLIAEGCFVAESSVAEESAVQQLIAGMDCKTVVLTAARPQAAMEGSPPLWALVNVGPASAAVRTGTDPNPVFVVNPDPGGSMDMFVGDDRHRYNIGLVAPNSAATVHVCAPF